MRMQGHLAIQWIRTAKEGHGEIPKEGLRPFAGGVIPKDQALALEDTLETVVNAFHLKLNQAGSRFLLCSGTLL